jgi:hypothetical protein
LNANILKGKLGEPTNANILKGKLGEPTNPSPKF